MSPPILCLHQTSKIRKLLMLRVPERIMVFHGLVGLGKTTLIPHLVDRINRPTVCPMTHKTACVLRSRDIPDAQTSHAACMTPLPCTAKTSKKCAMRPNRSAPCWRSLADGIARRVAWVALIWTATASQQAALDTGCYCDDPILSADTLAPVIDSNLGVEK